MKKRQRFILTSALLSLGFIGIGFLDNQYRLLSIVGLSLFTLLLFVWALREGLGKNLTLLTLILPMFFTIGVGLFWFLLPSHLLAQIPVVILYGMGIYVLCLTSNIYTVAATRTIALLRAARGVGFVLTLLTLFLLYDAILSLKLNAVFTVVAVVLVSYPLFLQGYWSIPLEKRLSKKTATITAISTLVMAEIAFSLHFWPTTVVVGSLFFTVACYVLLGLGQAQLEGRLFKQTVREYLILGVLVFVGMFYATRWSG